MKGISAIIATLLMLIITIGLAGLAYSYISGVFTTKTEMISLVDSFCSNKEAHFVVRNEGTTTIKSNQLSVVNTGGNCKLDQMKADIPAGSTVMLNATDCNSGPVSIRLIGPSNALSLTTYCP
jgi:flagellin-like protein